ncbi:MAG: adenylate/guanylate cyclase domain-containing protein [Reyranellaceae bacterium]
MNSERILGRLRLSTIMASLFLCLTIPVLIVILAYSYYRNSQAMIATLDEQVAMTRRATVENVQDMVEGVAGTLRVLAATSAAAPSLFRGNGGREVLFQALTTREEIDAAFVSYEDGYHRAVTRIDDNRRRADPRIPANARWHSNYIDPYSAGATRSRHREFFSTWGIEVGQYAVTTTTDYRTTSGYPQAKATLALAITQPEVNVDTGFPIINIRYPIMRDGTFDGTSGVSVTPIVLSRFLAAHRASPNSKTLIADPTTLTIIATSEPDKSVRMEGGKLVVPSLDTIDDAEVRKANELFRANGKDRFLFRSPSSGEDIVASFVSFETGGGSSWETVILTPVDDFIGHLEQTNRQVLLIIVVLSLVELVAIFLLARRLAQPIVTISEQLRNVESLSFEPFAEAKQASRVKEIAQLQSATSLLGNSLRSFASFAPVDVVKGLVRSGVPLALGVEARFLSVVFVDLENFSTQAEHSTPDALLQQMSVYFEKVSDAFASEGGTIDKFIGDGVMAFWGAPQEQPDHAFRACVGALRAVRRMEAVNEAWRREGKPTYRVRIGIHCGEVLVGNVGSPSRFSYTVMGDTVNVAARLEGVNKQYRTSICVSEAVLAAAGKALATRPLQEVAVKGRRAEIMVYELLGIAGSDDPELAAAV